MVKSTLGKIMKIKKILILSLLFTSSFAHSQERIHNHRPDQVVIPTGMNEVVFVDHKLNREYSERTWLANSKLKKINISLEKSVIQTNSVGYKKVTSIFRNHTDYDYVLEARTHFFDENELPSDTVSKWKRVFIPANSIQVYEILSIDRATNFFRTEVRSSI